MELNNNNNDMTTTGEKTRSIVLNARRAKQLRVSGIIILCNTCALLALFCSLRRLHQVLFLTQGIK